MNKKCQVKSLENRQMLKNIKHAKVPKFWYFCLSSFFLILNFFKKYKTFFLISANNENVIKNRLVGVPHHPLKIIAGTAFRGHLRCKPSGSERSLKEKDRVTMPQNCNLECCGKKIKKGELWFLQDFNGFIERKLYTSKCPYCGDNVVTITETKIDKNGQTTTYTRHSINGIEAVKILYREKKRKLKVQYDIKPNTLYGWIYGINRQYRNKKGDVIKIKQYSSDFSGNKEIVKFIRVN